MNKRFLLSWMFVLVIGFLVAYGVFSTNLELISTLKLTEANGELIPTLQHITSSDEILVADAISSARQFLFVTYGMLSISSLLFAFLVARRMKVPKTQQKSVEYRTVNHLQYLLLSMLVLVVVSYSLQLSMQDPLEGMQRIYGQPSRFYFGFQAGFGVKSIRTNPFIWPSIVFGGASVLLFLLYGTPFRNGDQRFTGILFRIETFWRGIWITRQSDKSAQEFMNWYAETHYKRLGVISFLGFVSLLLVSSVFKGGVTYVEIPKIGLIIGLSGYVTHKVQMIKDFPGKQEKERRNTFILGIIVLLLMGGVLMLLNDLGAILIVGFVVLLVCYSVVWRDAVWKYCLGLYTAAFIIKKTAPEWFTSQKERLADWTLTDYFFTSGLGADYVPGTASSPDFAKGLWGIAAGGWTGRWTALFAQDGKDGTYLASMAFGYNDRAGSALIEVFGWLGLLFVMVAYLVFILNALYLFQIPQRKFVPRFGVALGVGALFFGQIVVHFGGNFGFIPFTGIVLPFLSHSGLSFLFNIALITFLVALYLPADVLNDDAETVSPSSLVGMFKLVYLTTALVLMYAGWQTIVKASSYSTRVRYDIQADKSIKRTVNPRLFLLTDRMDVSGRIVDVRYNPDDESTVENALVKDGHGEYTHLGFDESDYFLHEFEAEHKYTLKGLHQKPYKDNVYFQKVCVLKDGQYHQFAGTSLEEAKKKVEEQNISMSLGIEGLDIEEAASQYNCTVQKVVRGTLWKDKVVGEPVDPKDPSKGCQVNPTGSIQTGVVLPYIPGTTDFVPEHSVWYFDFEGESFSTIKPKLEPYLEPGASPKIPRKPLSYEDVPTQTAEACVVATWHIDDEERWGSKSGDLCIVENADGDLVEYGENTIDGKALSTGSARQISIMTAASVQSQNALENSVEGDGTLLDEAAIQIMQAKQLQMPEHACVAKIKRVACSVGGDSRNYGNLWIDQNDPDPVAGISSIKVYYGTNLGLGFTDTVCKVSKHTMGSLKELVFKDDESPMLKASKYFYKKPIEEIASSYEKDVVSLHRFAKSDVSDQFGYRDDFAKEVPKTIVQIGLHAPLQSAIRQILIKKMEVLTSPSVQALVFDVNSGQILAQAQATRPREDYKHFIYELNDKGMPKLQKSGLPVIKKDANFQTMFTDKGMYGYGLNNLDSSLVPASTFKVLHALAAIQGGFTDFEHKCDVHNGYLPEDANWPCQPGKDCSIKDYGRQKGYSSHNDTSSRKTNLSKAITLSCNQYFAALAYEHTHPEVLSSVCSEKGLKYIGPDYQECSLREAKTRGAASNGWGQELLMDVYQMAGVLQAVSTNTQPYIEDWRTYMHPEERGQKSISDFKPLFDGEGGSLIERHILKGMYEHPVAYTNISSKINGVRAYGKTGTGDHEISTNLHRQERIGDYIEPVTYYKGRRNEVTFWKEDYEAPYGVTKETNMAIFVALVEKESTEYTKKLRRDRIGVVVRIPRTESPNTKSGQVSGGGVAGPIAKEIIQKIDEFNLIPSEE